MVMTAGQVLPSTVAAQQGGGLFGRGDSQEEKEVMLRGNDRDGVFNVGNEPFGAAGSHIGNEPFGAPIGGGIALLVAAGIGYAAFKSKKDKQNH